MVTWYDGVESWMCKTVFHKCANTEMSLTDLSVKVFCLKVYSSLELCSRSWFLSPIGSAVRSWLIESFISYRHVSNVWRYLNSILREGMLAERYLRYLIHLYKLSQLEVETQRKTCQQNYPHPPFCHCH